MKNLSVFNTNLDYKQTNAIKESTFASVLPDQMLIMIAPEHSYMSYWDNLPDSVRSSFCYSFNASGHVFEFDLMDQLKFNLNEIVRFCQLLEIRFILGYSRLFVVTGDARTSEDFETFLNDHFDGQDFEIHPGDWDHMVCSETEDYVHIVCHDLEKM